MTTWGDPAVTWGQTDKTWAGRTPLTYADDLYATCWIQLGDADPWTDLPPAETWAAQPPAGLWATDNTAETPAALLSPTGGAVTKDTNGVAVRTTARIILPPTAPISQGQEARIYAAVAAAADDEPGDPELIAHLFIVAVDAVMDARTWQIEATAEDLVTLLGARQLDTGHGPTGYLPTARTCLALITELVSEFGPPSAHTTIAAAAPDAPWTPDTDPETGYAIPVTGGVWALIEQAADRAGLVLRATGRALRIHPADPSRATTGLTITADPAYPGIQADQIIHREAPTITRIIATGTTAGGARATGRANDPATAAEQGFDWDELFPVDNPTTTHSLGIAAVNRMDYQRSARQSGQAHIPWVPILDPGDVVTVAWPDPLPMRSQWIDAVTIPLDPAEGVTVTFRGYPWPAWEDEPAGQPWSATDPQLTWAKDM